MTINISKRYDMHWTHSNSLRVGAMCLMPLNIISDAPLAVKPVQMSDVFTFE